MMPSKPIERRHIRNRDNYGWSQGAAWWDYLHPACPSGPDPSGWGSFSTAKIYTAVEGDFFAVALGCHWKGLERHWAPSWAICTTLEGAMDFCEADMVARGTLPPWST
jgi:hypothetical protein